MFRYCASISGGWNPVVVAHRRSLFFVPICKSITSIINGKQSPAQDLIFFFLDIPLTAFSASARSLVSFPSTSSSQKQLPCRAPSLGVVGAPKFSVELIMMIQRGS